MGNMHFRKLVVASWVLFPTLFGGTPICAQTLTEALASAYSTNPGLLSQRSDLSVIDEGVPQALGNWRPKIELSADLEREITSNNTRLTEGEKDQIRSPRNATLTVTQSVFRGFRTRAEVNQAELAVLSKRTTLIGAEQDLLLSAATEYLTVLQNQAVLELNKKNEQVLRRQLEATRDRFQVGEITRTDVSQAEARLAGAIATRIKSHGDLNISRASYINVVGSPPGKLTRPKSLSDLPKHLEEAKDVASATHPDIVQARLASKTSQEAVTAKKGQLYPILNIVGTFKRDWESINNESQVTTGEVKLDLTIPLYQKGTVFSGLRKAKLAASKTRIDLEETSRTVAENVESTWESLKAAQARIKSFQAQIEAARIALEGVERESSVGSRTVLDVLDAEQELLDANVSLIGAQRDEILASFQLMEAIGRLTAKNLGLPVELFDPTAYYNSVRNRLFGLDPPDVRKTKN